MPSKRTIILFAAALGAPSTWVSAQAPADVPAKHWARPCVVEMVKLGVMPASAGRFAGDKPVNRRDFAIILAAWARAIQRTPAAFAEGAAPVNPPSNAAAVLQRPITRYQLAAVLCRMARLVVRGLPRSGGPYLKSEAIPPAPKVTVAKSDPAYSAVTYLVQNRMAYGDSVALHPGPASVTGQQAAQALAKVVTGLNDKVTTEPEDRPELAEPPKKGQ